MQVAYADNSKSFMTLLNDEMVSDIVMTGDTLAFDLTDVIKVFRFCLLDNDALMLQEISHWIGMPGRPWWSQTGP